MNPFGFALKMELDGKAYYEKLAKEASNEGLKKIFHSLAQDELKHFETIQAMNMHKTILMLDSVVLEQAQNVFQTLLSEKKSAIQLSKDLIVYQHAMTVEAKSYRLYEDMAKKENNAEISRILLQIADEEKKHFNIMDNIYTFMLAPYNFLAWGEFSNLTEYY